MQKGSICFLYSIALGIILLSYTQMNTRLLTSTLPSQVFILRFSACTCVINPTASDVLAVSIDCCSKSPRDFCMCAWNSVISLLSMFPNRLSTSLCQESYLRLTLDCTLPNCTTTGPISFCVSEVSNVFLEAL